MSKVLLINGDATKLSIPSNSVDLIIAHPPYFGLDPKRYGGDQSKQLGKPGSNQKQFLKLMNKATKEMYRVLKPSGNLWISNSPFDGIDSLYITDVLNNTKFLYIDKIFHSYYKDKSVVPNKNIEELVFNSVSIWHHFAKTNNFYYNHVECRRYNNPIWEMDFSNLSDPVDVQLSADYVVQDAVNKELATRLIKMYSKPNQTVLDPFGGTGIVPVSAAELGRNGILNDISEKQIEGAKKRILLTLGENFD